MEQATAEVDRLGAEPVGNPLEQLAELAGKARRWEEVLSGQMSELGSLTYETGGGVETLRAVVPLWERSLDRCAAFCATLAKLDIDERIIRINIATARGVAGEVTGVLERVFSRIGVDYHSDEVRQIVAEEFYQLRDRLTS